VHDCHGATISSGSCRQDAGGYLEHHELYARAPTFQVIYITSIPDHERQPHGRDLTILADEVRLTLAALQSLRPPKIPKSWLVMKTFAGYGRQKSSQLENSS